MGGRRLSILSILAFFVSGFVMMSIYFAPSYKPQPEGLSVSERLPGLGLSGRGFPPALREGSKINVAIGAIFKDEDDYLEGEAWGAWGVINSYTSRGLTKGSDSRLRSFKTIISPSSCTHMTVHICSRFSTEYCSNLESLKSCSCTISTDLTQCLDENTLSQKKNLPEFKHTYQHHYRTKSVEEFWKKRGRGRAGEYNVYMDDSLIKNVEKRLEDLTRKKRLKRILINKWNMLCIIIFALLLTLH